MAWKFYYSFVQCRSLARYFCGKFLAVKRLGFVYGPRAFYGKEGAFENEKLKVRFSAKALDCSGLQRQQQHDSEYHRLVLDSRVGEMIILWWIFCF